MSHAGPSNSGLSPLDDLEPGPTTYLKVPWRCCRAATEMDAIEAIQARSQLSPIMVEEPAEASASTSTSSSSSSSSSSPLPEEDHHSETSDDSESSEGETEWDRLCALAFKFNLLHPDDAVPDHPKIDTEEAGNWQGTYAFQTGETNRCVHPKCCHVMCENCVMLSADEEEGAWVRYKQGDGERGTDNVYRQVWVTKRDYRRVLYSDFSPSPFV